MTWLMMVGSVSNALSTNIAIVAWRQYLVYVTGLTTFALLRAYITSGVWKAIPSVSIMLMVKLTRSRMLRSGAAPRASL